MSLSLRDKQLLYHHLGQLTLSGVSFPLSLTSLLRTSRGKTRILLQHLEGSIQKGLSIGESFAKAQPNVGGLEVGMITAMEQSGRLSGGFTQLADYFGAMAAARESILQKSMYPLGVAHLSVFIFHLKTLFTSAGLPSYLLQTFGLLAAVYLVTISLAFLAFFLWRSGNTSARTDGLLRVIPLLGRIRVDFATARFSATYGMQLSAGIHLVDALQSANLASQSGLISRAVEAAISQVRKGELVSQSLVFRQAFRPEWIESFSVGEQTGRLDAELARLAEESRKSGLARVERLAGWLPRFLGLLVLLGVGYGIVDWYRDYFGQISGLLDSP